MCTVTVVPAGEGAFRLVCNRDERLTRPAASSPQLHRLGARTAIYPGDPAGGTWLGVNDAGLAAAILNRSRGVARSLLSSRGLIIPRCLAAADLDGALRTAGDLALEQFAPFSLVLVHRGRVAVATSDGRAVSIDRLALRSPVLFTSSSLGDELVDAPRRQLFGELVLNGRNASSSWLDGQARFHRHQWPGHPELSVFMQRADAATISRSAVDVTPRSVRLRDERVAPRAEAAA